MTKLPNRVLFNNRLGHALAQEATRLVEQNAEISRAIVNLGHSLNMKVVAEGIELERQLEFLKNEGCDEGQGFLIAKPLPHDDFVDYLRQHAAGGSGCHLEDEKLQPLTNQLLA